MPDFRKAADLIGEIIAKKKLSQTELGSLLGVERAQVSRYISGERNPGPFPCLILAALAESSADKEFFIGASGITQVQIELLGSVLNLSPTMQSGEERELIEFWRRPLDAIESSLKQLIADTLKEHAEKLKAKENRPNTEPL